MERPATAYHYRPLGTPRGRARSYPRRVPLRLQAVHVLIGFCSAPARFGAAAILPLVFAAGFRSLVRSAPVLAKALPKRQLAGQGYLRVSGMVPATLAMVSH